MTMEWIRFWITAVLLFLALLSFLSAVIGVYRFGFVMNRMHAAGIGDTMGLFCVILALVVSSTSVMAALKLILVLAFMWCTSPVSTHFLGQAEYFMNENVSDHYERAGGAEDESGSDC